MKTLVANFNATTEDLGIIGKVITLTVITLIAVSAIALAIGVALNGAPNITIG